MSILTNVMLHLAKIRSELTALSSVYLEMLNELSFIADIVH